MPATPTTAETATANAATSTASSAVPLPPIDATAPRDRSSATLEVADDAAGVELVVGRDGSVDVPPAGALALRVGIGGMTATGKDGVPAAPAPPLGTTPAPPPPAGPLPGPVPTPVGRGPVEAGGAGLVPGMAPVVDADDVGDAVGEPPGGERLTGRLPLDWPPGTPVVEPVGSAVGDSVALDDAVGGDGDSDSDGLTDGSSVKDEEDDGDDVGSADVVVGVLLGAGWVPGGEDDGVDVAPLVVLVGVGAGVGDVVCDADDVGGGGDMLFGELDGALGPAGAELLGGVAVCERECSGG